MRRWLEDRLAACDLSDGHRAYLLGRGVKPATLQNMGFRTWMVTDDDPNAPDPVYRERHGPHGDRQFGWLAVPIRSARGTLIGVEWRRPEPKAIIQHLVPEASWNPVLIGLPQAMPALWAGGEAWIVEGVFDLAALQWLVPETHGVLATIRARLSGSHVELLRRLRVPAVNIVYDNDSTGRAATGRALRELARAGLRGRDIRYLGGKDPGVIWDRGGLDAMRQAFKI